MRQKLELLTRNCWLLPKENWLPKLYYYDAYFKNKESKFEASNIAVQKLAKNYSSYKYFGAKGWY